MFQNSLKKEGVFIFLLGIGLLIFVFLSHLPFLSADADSTSYYGSRGPWIDEGLNTIQIRNYVNHDQFDLMGGDNFLKTPLLSGLLYFPLQVFGSEMEVARLVVVLLLGLVTMAFFGFKRFRITAVLLMSSTLLFFPVHQFTHLALAEICSSAMILMAALTFSKEKSENSIFLTCFLLMLAFLFKVQFVYILILPLLAIIGNNLLSKKKIIDKIFIRSFLVILLFILLVSTIGYFFLSEELQKIAQQQSGNFNWEAVSFDLAKNNLEVHFFQNGQINFTTLYLVSLMFAVVLLFKRPNTANRKFVLFSIIWSVLEWHKLFMEYLPLRYLVSTYFSMGFLMASVFSCYLKTSKYKVFKLCIVAAFSGLFCLNILNLFETYENRTFASKEVNEYLEKHKVSEGVILGSWAPSFTWKSKNISYPLWVSFMPSENPVKDFRPRVIVSELDEGDSGGVYQKLGVNLLEDADSVRIFHITKWDVGIYWFSKIPN